MPLILIDSLEDPRIAAYRNLPERSTERNFSQFIVEGAWLVERLLASGHQTQSLLVELSRAADWIELVPDEFPVFAVEKEVLDKLVGFSFHRGVMACGVRKPQRSLKDVAGECTEPAMIVACERISDPENLGAISRNCAAFGVQALLLGPKCADPFSRRALRVSMGTLLKLEVIESNDLIADLIRLRDEHQFELTATILDPSATTLKHARRAKRNCLLFGNEGNGLSEEVLSVTQQQVTIPMQLGTDSLNVAVAAGIVLYHFAE